MRTKTTAVSFLLAILIFALGACDLIGGDDDEGIDLESATFEASVEGDVERDFTGEAYYTSVDSTVTGSSEGGFAILLITMTDSDTSAIAFQRSGEDVPGEGSYDISTIGVNDDGLEDVDGFVATYISSSAEAQFLSESGELTIVQAENGQLEGTFSFEAEEFTFFGGGEDDMRIEVNGAFSAEFENYDELQGRFDGNVAQRAGKRGAVKWF